MEAHHHQRAQIKAAPLRPTPPRGPRSHKKVLTAQLRELESAELICRKNLGDSQDHLSYALTSYGRTLVPILSHMAKWGATHKARLAARPAELAEPVK